VNALDAVLGIVLGCVAGVAFRPLWSWGWDHGARLLGPLTSAELHPKVGDVPPKAFARDLTAGLVASLIVAVTWFVLTIPMQAFVASYRRFLFVWVIALLVSAVVMSFLGRDAA
jgi:hypothetical protein